MTPNSIAAEVRIAEENIPAKLPQPSWKSRGLTIAGYGGVDSLLLAFPCATSLSWTSAAKCGEMRPILRELFYRDAQLVFDVDNLPLPERVDRAYSERVSLDIAGSEGQAMVYGGQSKLASHIPRAHQTWSSHLKTTFAEGQIDVADLLLE